MADLLRSRSLSLLCCRKTSSVTSFCFLSSLSSGPSSSRWFLCLRPPLSLLFPHSIFLSPMCAIAWILYLTTADSLSPRWNWHGFWTAFGRVSGSFFFLVFAFFDVNVKLVPSSAGWGRGWSPRGTCRLLMLARCNWQDCDAWDASSL